MFDLTLAVQPAMWIVWGVLAAVLVLFGVYKFSLAPKIAEKRAQRETENEILLSETEAIDVPEDDQAAIVAAIAAALAACEDGRQPRVRFVVRKIKKL